MKIDLTILSMTALMDLLAEKTQQMTQLLADKEFGPLYDECKKQLADLMSEIAARRKKEN